MMISRFQGREILPAVKVTDKNIEIFYLQKTGASGESLKLTLRHLMINSSENAATSIRKDKLKLVEKVYS